jgi:Na+:H+ antiporter, NhaA family
MTLARKNGTTPRRALSVIIEHPLAAGIALLGATILALLVANSPLSDAYHAGLKAYVGPLSVGHWINDALMAVFFLLVGLELKRELVDGELASWGQRILPGVAAACGVILPALIYTAINQNDPQAMRGWAIPAATDIAFALGVLSLLGSRVPISLKVFLTTIAVLDDLAAIIIIALFYTSDLSLLMLALAAVTLGILVIMNMRGVTDIAPYLMIGALLWVFVLNSGVHATIAGVALAMTIPRLDGRDCPLQMLEHALQPWVAFLILPVFAFANAGVTLTGLSFDVLLEPLTLGIAAGLFVGKQAGIFLSVFLAEKIGLANRPLKATWLQVYGVALLCGIGFTMSLFIGLLAFDGAPHMQDGTKIGVLAGSFVSAVLGWVVLRLGGRRPPSPAPSEDDVEDIEALDADASALAEHGFHDALAGKR